jgi:hypothetical protein
MGEPKINASGARQRPAHVWSPMVVVWIGCLLFCGFAWAEIKSFWRLLFG